MKNRLRGQIEILLLAISQQRFCSHLQFHSPGPSSLARLRISCTCQFLFAACPGLGLVRAIGPSTFGPYMRLQHHLYSRISARPWKQIFLRIAAGEDTDDILNLPVPGTSRTRKGEKPQGRDLVDSGAAKRSVDRSLNIAWR